MKTIEVRTVYGKYHSYIYDTVKQKYEFIEVMELFQVCMVKQLLNAYKIPVNFSIPSNR